MVRWHHQINGHEFEQTLGDSEGQGNLVCCSPWGCKESDTTERLNHKLLDVIFLVFAWPVNVEMSDHNYLYQSKGFRLLN